MQRWLSGLIPWGQRRAMNAKPSSVATGPDTRSREYVRSHRTECQ